MKKYAKRRAAQTIRAVPNAVLPEAMAPARSIIKIRIEPVLPIT